MKLVIITISKYDYIPCLNYKDLDSDKKSEVNFSLGIIYKEQGKYDQSLACFDRILRNPPNPLTHGDVWFQIGDVYEEQQDVCN
jgi:general transcriptional corepressor CYC8